MATAIMLSRGDADSLNTAKHTTIISSCGFYVGAIGLAIWAFGK